VDPDFFFFFFFFLKKKKKKTYLNIFLIKRSKKWGEKGSNWNCI